MVSGLLLRWACAGSVVSALVAPLPLLPVAHAVPAPEKRSVTALLMDLQRLYREAEESTETYNATEEELAGQRRRVADLNRRLAAARAAARDGRGAAGRLARQQYQNSSMEISSYVRLLLARSPRGALDQRHVLRRAAADRAATVARLTEDERRAEALARAARRALGAQESLARRQQEARDGVRARLHEVEELLASLTAAELDALARAERRGTSAAQRRLVASGALGTAEPGRAPSAKGARAVRYALKQVGKPYAWGAEGPTSFDCSGLTQRAWDAGGRDIPRTSQQQWAQLRRVPLSRLRPGDLVVYYPKATHVALYVGEGKVVHAPRPGTRVRVSPIATNPVLGAVRPDPRARPVPDYHPPKLPPVTGTAADAVL